MARVPDEIAAHGWDLVRCDDTSKADGGVSEQIADADILVVGLVPVTPETLVGANNLKAVIKHGVGVDNIDIPACTAKSLPVCNTPAANADAVAELAVGFMYAMARFIPQGHVCVTGWQMGTARRHPARWQDTWHCWLGQHRQTPRQTGNWHWHESCRNRSLCGYGLCFRAWHRNPVTWLDDLLGKARLYYSLHIFGGKDNAALINPETITKMKPGAKLINLARGEVVDLDAIAAALESGQLGGVAIDAYVTEPPETSHPVFSHPNAIFTPHSGADTKESC